MSRILASDWNISNTYKQNDIVTYNSEQYYALKDVPAGFPFTTDNFGGYSSVDGIRKPTFIWNPSYRSLVKGQPRTKSTSFGDGYEQRYSSLPNNLLEFDLVFENRSPEETAAILHFLSSRQNVESFYWTPYDPFTLTKAFVCVSFNTENVFFGNNRITARFKEFSSKIFVAVPAIPEPEPEPDSPEMEGLYGWYIGDTVNQSDLTFVNSWADQSGNSNNLTSSGSIIRVVHSGLNGHKILRWVNIGQMQKNAGVFIPGIVTGFTFIQVVRRTSYITYDQLYIYAGNFLSTAAAVLAHITGGNVNYRSNHISSVNGPTVAVNTWQIVTLSVDYTELVERLSTNTLTGSGSWTSGPVALNNIQWQHEFGELAEGLIYRRKLTAAQLWRTRRYLAFKYGLSIADV